MNTVQRFNVLERDGFTCRYCGRKAPEVVLHVDHIVPVSAGGTDRRDNLITACRDCNRGKWSRLLQDNEQAQSRLKADIDWHRLNARPAAYRFRQECPKCGYDWLSNIEFPKYCPDCRKPLTEDAKANWREYMRSYRNDKRKPATD